MVSFIVIGRNEGQRLVHSIKSIHRFIQEESINDCEIIYVDSQSTDKSVENAISLGIKKIFIITGICNAAIGRNIGAKEAIGDILFFLDGDMQLIPGFFSTIVDEEGNMRYPFVSGIESDVLYDNEWKYVKTQYRRKFIPEKVTYEITTGGMFCISRTLWNEIKGMDGRLRANEDLDVGIRLYRKGFPLCRKPDLWVNHYTRFYSVREESESNIEYTALLIRKHIIDLKVQFKLLVSTYSYWLLIGCLLLTFFFPFWIPLIVYLSTVFYRSMRIIQRTDVKLNPLKVFKARLKKDLKFWWYFVFYWPKTPQQEYIQASSKL